MQIKVFLVISVQLLNNYVRKVIGFPLDVVKDLANLVLSVNMLWFIDLNGYNYNNKYSQHLLHLYFTAYMTYSKDSTNWDYGLLVNTLPVKTNDYEVYTDNDEHSEVKYVLNGTDS